MIKKSVLLMMVVGLMVLTSCGVHIEFQSPTSQPVAPPVEGNESAPPVEASAGEILLAQVTPSGVLVMTDDNQTLKLLDLDGSEAGATQVPDIGGSDPRNLHLAGSWQLGQSLPPVVYYAFQPEQSLRLSTNGTVNNLRSSQSFQGLVGAAGQPAFAFSDVSFEKDTPVSHIYAGTPDSIKNVSAFYEFQDTQMGMVLMPVAVEAAGGQPQGVWYIQTAWGIGGVDIIYLINRGLFFFDLTSGENSLALNLDRNFQGLSPDHNLVASVPFDGGGNAAMTVLNLENGNETSFSLNSATDRGSGYGVFSPDGQYIAWLEASGSLTGNPEYKPIIRVGDTGSGGVVAELDKTAAAQAGGWPTVSWMKPVGFLNDQVVLVEARGENWNDVAVLKYDFSSNTASLFSRGSFSGFAFP
jgi:hypothetical protein